MANSKIDKRFRKGEDFIMGCAGLGSSARPLKNSILKICDLALKDGGTFEKICYMNFQI